MEICVFHQTGTEWVLETLRRALDRGVVGSVGASLSGPVGSQICLSISILSAKVSVSSLQGPPGHFGSYLSGFFSFMR